MRDRRHAFALLLLLAACSSDSSATHLDAAPSIPDAAVPRAVEYMGWSITANTPQLSSDGATLTGSVTFARASGSDTRGGGLCLVADLHDSTPCTTEADCAAFPVPEGGFHYCVGINGSATKTCWTRPSADGCTRAPDRVPGIYTSSPAAARVDGKPTTWIGIACLAADGVPMGCAMPDLHIYATSPTLYVP